VNLDDYLSNHMEIGCTLLIPHITDLWHQQAEMHRNCPYLSNVVLYLFSIVAQGVRVDSRVSVGQDVVGWRQSKTPGKTLCKHVIVGSLLLSKM